MQPEPNGKRIVYYDATDKTLAPRIWWPGGRLYRAAGMVDEVVPVESWSKLFQHLGWQETESVSQVEVWCHGMPGRAYINGKTLRVADDDTGLLAADVDTLGAYTAMRDDGVFWLRSCYSFAGPWGKRFAETIATELDCVAAGHTRHVAAWQAGLRTVAANEVADWPASEGGIGKKSWPWTPRCIPAWVNKIPDEWLP